MHKSIAIALLSFLGSSTIPLLAEENLTKNETGFAVIVNSQNAIGSLDRKFLADVYFKKITRWPADGPILPIDLRADAPARRKFSEFVLKRSVMATKSYWQRLIFSGQDVPPPEFLSDEEVIQYVLKNPNAIGYVANTSLSPTLSGVKTINIK